MRPGHAAGTCRSARDEVLLARRDERRLERRGARRRQPLCDERVPRAVGVGEVDAREAVDLEIDEPRDGDAASRSGEPDAADAAVDELDIAPQELAVDNRGLDPEPHSEPFTANEFQVCSRFAQTLAACGR